MFTHCYSHITLSELEETYFIKVELMEDDVSWSAFHEMTSYGDDKMSDFLPMIHIISQALMWIPTGPLDITMQNVIVNF